MEGEKGILNEPEFLRPAAGRVYERQVKLATESKIVIVDTVKTEFNEIWYKVAANVDGKVMYGYLQAAAVDIGTKLQPTPGKSGLTKVGTGGLSTTHGKDKDGDGVYVVVLDPGHGSQFSGAYHFGASEHKLTLKVANYCKEYLEANYDNVKVYLTRTGDSCLDQNSDVDDLERRVRVARSKGADILVSLHFDAFAGSARGAEGLIPHEKQKDKCMALASQILQNLQALGITNLGCMTRLSERSYYSYPGNKNNKMDGYLINRLGIESGIVTCIIEHAHMDNKDDFYSFCDGDEKLKKLGEADAKGIASYLGLKAKGTSTPTPTPEPEPTQEPEPTPTSEPEPTAEPEPTLSAEPEPTVSAEPEPTPSTEPEPSPSAAPSDNSSGGGETPPDNSSGGGDASTENPGGTTDPGGEGSGV